MWQSPTGRGPASAWLRFPHSSTRTARQHYAGGRYGWTADFTYARPDPDLVAAIAAHNSPKSPVSAKNEILGVAPFRAVEFSERTDASVEPAAAPPRLTVMELENETVPTVPIIEDDIMSRPFRVDEICETDEAPALGMG